VVDPLLQRALEMRETLPTTPELHLLADIIPPFLTSCTLSARQAHLERDLVSGLEVRDGGAYGADYAGGLVAEREGFADEDVAVSEVGVVVEVAAAEAGGRYLDLDFVC